MSSDSIDEADHESFLFVRSVETQLCACFDGIKSRGRTVFYVNIEESLNLLGTVEMEWIKNARGVGYDHHKFVKRNMTYKQALPVIRDQVMPLLRVASYNCVRSIYDDPRYVKRVDDLIKFIESWFSSHSHSGARQNQTVVVQNSREEALQHEVEQLKKEVALKTRECTRLQEALKVKNKEIDLLERMLKLKAES